MDAEDVVEAAAFAALNVPAVTELADVFQHVPEDTRVAPGRGILIIGDMTSEAIVTKGGRDEQVNLTIAAVVEAEERKPVRALKAVVKAALHGATVTRDGWTLQFQFVDSDGFLDPETGQAYAGNFRFTVWAFAQD